MVTVGHQTFPILTWWAHRAFSSTESITESNKSFRSLAHFYRVNTPSLLSIPTVFSRTRFI